MITKEIKRVLAEMSQLGHIIQLRLYRFLMHDFVTLS